MNTDEQFTSAELYLLCHSKNAMLGVVLFMVLA